MNAPTLARYGRIQATEWRQVFTKGKSSKYGVKILGKLLRHVGMIEGCILQTDPEDSASDVTKKVAENREHAQTRETPDPRK